MAELSIRLTKLRELLGITGSEKDAELEHIIILTEGRILDYINLEVLPNALEPVLLSICVQYYRSAGLGCEAPAAGTVTSVQRGDVKTSFQPAAGAFDLEGSSFFGWRVTLNKYRKLRR